MAITVELTDEQAALFILFQKNYHTIAFMIANGVFDIPIGEAILKFSRGGKLVAVEKHVVAYVPKELSPLNS